MYWLYSLMTIAVSLFFVQAEANEFPPQVSSVDPTTMIHVNSSADVAAVRAGLVAKIYGQSGVNLTRVPTYYSTFPPLGYWAIPNIDAIEEWRVTVSKGMVSRLYRFKPENQRNASSGKGAVIISAGHGQVATMNPYAPVIVDLIAAGYEVWTVDMPASGLNAPPYADYQTLSDQASGNVLLSMHMSAQALYTPDFNPLRLFLEPATAIVNYLAAQGHTDISMLGLSGGGWTTDVSAALDPRIKRSYSIAGSMPLYMRSWVTPAVSFGDWEQMAFALLGVDYMDLYILAASNGRHVNMYIPNDDCCFGGTMADHFGPTVKSRVSTVGGSFDVIYDTTVSTHTVSEWAKNFVVNEILGTDRANNMTQASQ